MAVSTTTTLNDITLSAAIDPVFMDYAHDFMVVSPFLREYYLAGRGSKAIDVPSLASNMGTVNDGGTGVATAYDGTEGTDLSTATTQSTNKKTVTSVEYAVYMAITDDVGEDSVAADEVMDEILTNASRIITAAFEDDVCALFAALNGGTAVGSTTVDLTLANLASAVVTIRNNGVRAPDGLVAVLAPVQASDWEDANIAASTSQAVFQGTADRFMAINRNPNNGLTDGMIGDFRGIPLFMTGLCDFANTNADRVGAMFVPSTARNNRFAALGKTISRELRIETDRDITLRGVELVASARYGSGELSDASGVPIVTDA